MVVTSLWTTESGNHCKPIFKIFIWLKIKLNLLNENSKSCWSHIKDKAIFFKVKYISKCAQSIIVRPPNCDKDHLSMDLACSSELICLFPVYDIEYVVGT